MDNKFNENMPIYLQIINKIKYDIISGNLKGGEKLPSVREMAQMLKVNPNTLQRAYQELERQGITYTQRGMGTFVSEDEDTIMGIKRETSKEMVINFINGMKNLGFSEEDIISIIKENLEGYDI